MVPFAASMFPDTVVLQAKVRPTPVGKRGGPEPTWTTPGTTLAAYVEVISGAVERADGDQAQPKSVRRYRVFAGTDSGALINDKVIWRGRTLVVREPSVIQGPLWAFEANDTE